MRIQLLLTTALALSPAIVLAASPAFAEIEDVAQELVTLQTEFAQLQSRADDFMVAEVYTCPPHNPVQLELQALARLSAKHAELDRRFTQARNEAKSEILRDPSSAQKDIPPYGRFKFDHSIDSMQASYWGAYKTALDRISKTIKAKEDALRRARVIPCKGDAPKTDIVVQPPLPPTPPTPPPPPPEPPKERLWDPMAGLTEPGFTAAKIPVPPNFFCSEAEKQAMLAQLEPAKEKLQREADAYEAYARQIESRKAQLTREGMPQHWQDSMDYAARQARIKRDDRLTTMNAVEQSRYLIQITEVRDCTTNPKDGLKTGWDFKAGFEVGLGAVDLPETGYLGVEDALSSERLNGVIKAENGDSEASRMRLGFELPLDWTPPNGLEPVGGRHLETRFFGTLDSVKASSSGAGGFDPMGDRLFIPGLTDTIADTLTLPPTFNATVRDNFVDRFRFRSDYERSAITLGLNEDFAFPGCDGFTVTKSFGLRHSWSDQRDVFQAEVLDYFPFASPGFNVRTEYQTTFDSSTTSLRLGFDGVYAPGSWGGLFVSAGAEGWVGYTDTDARAYRRVDVNGGIGEQFADFGKSEATFGFGLRTGVGYDFGGGKIELGVEYRQDGDAPSVQFGAGVPPSVDHGERDEFIGVLRTTFTF